MLDPVYSTQFKKDYKRCQKRNYSMQNLIVVMSELEEEIPLAKNTGNILYEVIMRVVWSVMLSRIGC